MLNCAENFLLRVRVFLLDELYPFLLKQTNTSQKDIIPKTPFSSVLNRHIKCFWRSKIWFWHWGRLLAQFQRDGGRAFFHNKRQKNELSVYKKISSHSSSLYSGLCGHETLRIVRKLHSWLGIESLEITKGGRQQITFGRFQFSDLTFYKFNIIWIMGYEFNSVIQVNVLHC